MTIIEKEYRCKEDRQDVLHVAVYSTDQDAALTITGDQTVVLTEKQIRKLIKQLKKALPDEKSEWYTRDNVLENVSRGDKVEIRHADCVFGVTVKGKITDIEASDPDQPIRVADKNGNYAWPGMNENTRIRKIK